MSVTQINSDSPIQIEEHFRISAGPGAGKTYWLITHIKNTLQNSLRLHKTRKIACITYTNVATETIISRLGEANEKVDVNTIHSFLYKHLVKPYCKFLEAYGLNASLLDGHDDTVLKNYSFIEEWKTASGQQRISDTKPVIEAFEELKWKFDASLNLIVRPKYPKSVGGYNIKTDSYLKYKELAWKKGVVHHDDILFFSYTLIKDHPFVLDVLRAKFPYFFVDEFQDCDPIQVEILKLIGQNETVVGIIGDEAQSIYGFLGATPAQFMSFNLPGIIDYLIADNRRSTNHIIDLLDKVRPAFNQNKIRNEAGDPTYLLVGQMSDAVNKAMEISGDINLYTLSRDNLTANIMKRHLNGASYRSDLIDVLLISDSPSSGNNYRSKVVISCLKAVEFARLKHFKDAIKEAESVYSKAMDKTERKKRALNIVSKLLNSYNDFKDKPFIDFFQFVKVNLIKDISNLRAGSAKTVYDNHTYLQMALCVKINEDTSLHRTIHKAKGAEFKSAMLILKEENDIEFVLNPDLHSKEEHRINYVAISRAMDNLFINVPQLSSQNEATLSSILTIVRIEG